MIRVANTRLERVGENIRVVADVSSNEGDKLLWYEVDGSFKSCLHPISGDPFAAALIIEAMHRGEALRLDANVSTSLIYGLRYYQHVMRCLYPALKLVEVERQRDSRCLDNIAHRVVGAGFSAGVDAFSTLYEYFFGDPKGAQVDYLIFRNAGSMGDGPTGRSVFAAYRERIQQAANAIGLPIVFVDSNLSEHVTVSHGSQGARLISCVLLLPGLFHTYLHQTANTYTNLIGDADGANPLADHLLSNDSIRIFSDGAQYSRIEKISRIADWDVVQRHLHVCAIATPDLRNCSRCAKCTATMIAIDMLGKRPLFERVFDFSQFAQAKQSYVHRNLARASVQSNYLWRELIRHAEQTGYRLREQPATAIKSLPVADRTRDLKPVEGRSVTAYWQQDGNFGDRLTGALLESYGISPKFASALDAEVVGAGSILQSVPERFSGRIVGSGFLHEYHNQAFPRAEIIAVRGRLSAERCRAPSECLLADAGLLAYRLLTGSAETRHTLAIVPHLADQEAPHLQAFASRYPAEVVLVNLRAEPRKVMQLIAGAVHVLSSSLYGLIAADALGKPNRWLLLSRHVPGGHFKFLDYYSAFNADADPLILEGGETLSEVLSKVLPPSPAAKDRGDELGEILGRL